MGRRRRRSRQSGNIAIFWVIGIFCFVIVGGGLSWYLVKKAGKIIANVDNPKDDSRASTRLDQVCEELDRKDPGWRLRELAANPRKVDDARNGAKIVMNISDRVPQNFSPSLGQMNDRILPSQQLSDNEISQARNYLRSCGPLIDEARSLNFYPDGAYRIDWNLKRPIDTPLPHGPATARVAALLLSDALVRGSDRDGVGSVQSANALLNLSRYLRDEPLVICQLVRLVTRQKAIYGIERALTCVNVPDDTLNLLQQGLEAEAATPSLRVALRGERAMIEAMATSASQGEAAWGQLTVSDDDIAWALRQYNAMIDLAERPFLKHTSGWETMIAEIMSARKDIIKIIPAINKVNIKLFRSDALMQAAAIAIAAERYRRANGDWPTDLQRLIPDYMKSIPVDRYAGEPFRFSRVYFGASVYSLPKGVPDLKGEFLTIGFADHETIGFRMLHANFRR